MLFVLQSITGYKLSHCLFCNTFDTAPFELGKLIKLIKSNKQKISIEIDKQNHFETSAYL